MKRILYLLLLVSPIQAEVTYNGAAEFLSSVTVNGGMTVNTTDGNVVINQSIGRVAIGTTCNGNPIVGTYNTSIGPCSGDLLESASYGNVILGPETLAFCTTCQRNVAVGLEALRFLNNGNRNVAIGYEAGYLLLDGSDNITLGTNSSVGSGPISNSIAMGHFSSAGGNNSIALGYSATVSGNNTMQIGGTGAFKMLVVMSSMTVSSGTVTTLATSDVTNRFGITSSTVTVNGFLYLLPITVAQFGALTPGTTFQYRGCADCATVSTCVSTATTRGGWALITNKGSQCQ